MYNNKQVDIINNKNNNTNKGHITSTANHWKNHKKILGNLESITTFDYLPEIVFLPFFYSLFSQKIDFIIITMILCRRVPINLTIHIIN